MKIAVYGGNGFIGHHLCRRLRSLGHYVLSVDIKECEYGNDHADDIVIADLRDQNVVDSTVIGMDQIFQMAADMGGCLYVFTGDHDADIMRNSAQINFNLCDALVRLNPKAKVFYSSSACMYPQELQNYHDGKGNLNKKQSPPPYDCALKESDAYPLNPDSDYGLEKAFSERLYLAYARNYGLDVRIARFHNIYGPEGTFKPEPDGTDKSKAPARIARKVAEENCGTHPGCMGIAEIWGDGLQTRSFLYIDDCIDAVLLLMQSEFKQPINIGSEEMISILDLWKMAIEISGKPFMIQHIEMPPNVMGVRGRNSNNDLIREKLGWEPKYKLYDGMVKTYAWVKGQVERA